MKTEEKAIVLLSGGQDSTTSLFWAMQRFTAVHGLTVSYGQAHSRELECAVLLAGKAGIEHEVISIDLFRAIGLSSLITGGDVKSHEGLPGTFVPGRNLVFLMYAAVFAYKLDISNLVIGVSQVDYSGYPDCRRETIESLQKTLNLGMDFPFIIHTPLIDLSKSDIVRLSCENGAYDMMKYTHTCYKGEKPPCGKCDACILRAKGFSEAGIPDPLIE